MEVGETTQCSQIVKRQARERIRELVAMTGGRAGIHALAPGERGLKLDAVAHHFLNGQLEGVIIGFTFIVQAADAAKLFVDSRGRVALAWVSAIRIGLIALWRKEVSEDIDFRIEIPGRSLCRENDIRIIDAE